MAKSKNGVHENGSHEAETNSPSAVDVASGNVSNSKHTGRPKKKSRRGQGGGPKTAAGKAQACDVAPAEGQKRRSKQGKGGGPKTAAGKLAVSRNAIKHGITSASPVIPGMESEELWQAYRSGIVESLEPEGWLETVLAVRIASLFWRLDRVVRYETAVTAQGVEYVSGDVAASDVSGRGALANGDLQEQPSQRNMAEAETWLLPTSFHLDRVMRYETHFHREMLQTSNLLEAVQARRHGQPTNLTRLDVSSSPQYRNTRAPALSDAFANLA